MEVALHAETAVVRRVLTLWNYGAIQHGKEQVLKNQSIVLTLFWIIQQILAVVRIKVFNKMIVYITLVEKFFRNKVLLFQEPHKYKTSNETDATLMIELFIIFCCSQVIGEASHLNSPSIPVAKF